MKRQASNKDEINRVVPLGNNEIGGAENIIENQNEKIHEGSPDNDHANGDAQKLTVKQRFIAYLKGMPKKYFITAFSGMAMGLFCTLIAGTIFAQIGGWIGDNSFGRFIICVANIAKFLMGAGIGIGIAHSFKSNKLVMFSAAVAGMVGAFSSEIMSGKLYSSLSSMAAKGVFSPGNPIGAYIASVICIEVVSLIAGKTKLDIILLPICTFVLSLACIYVAWPFIQLVNLIGKGIEIATGTAPFIMGIVISAVMGILLTMPTSSAAIWLTIALSNPGSEAILLAAGAATCGCAAHMIGFAVMSFRENKWGGLIAQGLGTSMLQIPNIMKHPIIFVPPVVASIIVGPLSTCVFKLKCTAAGGGMGTSGLVGVFGVIEASADVAPWLMWLGIILCMFVIPAAVCILLSELMRRKGIIKPDYLKLDL